MKYCKSCNSPCNDDDMFCSNCGEFVGEMTIEEAINTAIKNGDIDRNTEINNRVEIIDNNGRFEEFISERVTEESPITKYRNKYRNDYQDNYGSSDYQDNYGNSDYQDNPENNVYSDREQNETWDGNFSNEERNLSQNEGNHEVNRPDDYQQDDNFDDPDKTVKVHTPGGFGDFGDNARGGYNGYEDNIRDGYAGHAGNEYRASGNYENNFTEVYNGAEYNYPDHNDMNNRYYQDDVPGSKNEKSKKPKEKKGKKGLLITLICIVVVLAAAGYLIFFQGILGDYIKAESVSISTSQDLIGIGKEVKLSAKVSPIYTSQKVTWSVDDYNVASIDNEGNITGIARGTVTATAVSKDGNAQTSIVLDVTFSDIVDEDSIYINAAEWAADQGITGGFQDGTFGANKDCTRKQFALMLYKMAGSPEVEGKIDFTDCDSIEVDSKPYKAILWASQQGYINGKDGLFKPDGAITKQQVVIVLYRFAGEPEVQGSIHYTDVEVEEGTDKYNSILWAQSIGLTDGTDDGKTFGPSENCTRKDAVLFLNRVSNLAD